MPRGTPAPIAGGCPALPPFSLPEGQLFWQRKGKALPTESLWAAAAPAEVEMTAYVLLAHLTQPQVSSTDLARASQIVRWLSRQQNPYGGFASTQVQASGSQRGAGAAAGCNSG